MDASLFHKQYKVVENDNREWWQELGKEMTAYFGKNAYWVFWKLPEATEFRVRRAFQIAQKEGDRNFSHFLCNIKRG